MDYKINITEHADELLDDILYYLTYTLSNVEAARHLLDCLDKVYDRMESNPFQFPYSKDRYLAQKKYREAIVPQMHYTVIFEICENTVNIVGIFHHLENYYDKV